MRQSKLPYRYQVLVYFMILLLVTGLGFTYILVKKDRETKIERLKFQMQPYADLIYKTLSIYDSSSINHSTISLELAKIGYLLPKEMRITVLDSKAWVLYDNFSDKDTTLENHINRPELIESLSQGEGSALRFSNTLGSDYLYYAKSYPGLFIRTALEYKKSVLPVIKRDYQSQIYIGLLILILILILVYTVYKVSMPVSALKEFIDMVQNGKGDYNNIQFPNNEFGDVGEKIIQTFAQLEKTKKYKQELTHNVAHELKTPVTGIRGYLETLIQQENLDKDTSRLFLQRAYNQTLRLSAIIADISILNKIEEASDKFEVEQVNINRCIEEIKSDLSFKFDEKRIKFFNEVDKNLTINGINLLLYSLFKNLTDNSLEHAGENIEIHIRSTHSSDSHIFFEYYDTGKGVSEKHLDRIFERFYRVEEGRTRKGGGSGLGLSIVKNSILLHKGDICVENREGGGLLFKFSLSLNIK